jgi:hypothetical protein
MLKANLPQGTFPWVDSQGRPTQQFMQFLTQLAGQLNIAKWVTAANDTAAAAAGVSVGYPYLDNSGVMKIRMS